ncbi:MAG: GDP-L-fucose synthase [Pseudomonadales bacterium]
MRYSMRKSVFVAGHNGMVGSAIVRQLKQQGIEPLVCSRDQLDLKDSKAVSDFLQAEQVDELYVAAARVGGIHANNTYPADFIYDNLMIECNLIEAAFRAGVAKLLFLGSSCIYPKYAPQPMTEDALLTGVLEPTNEPYAIAKIAGIKLCESYRRQHGADFRSAMPTNLYGPNDNYHPENSHVIPALIARFHQAMQDKAEEVVVWGSGSPKREFLHVDDMAAACLHVMDMPEEAYWLEGHDQLSHVNVGTGIDCSIREAAETIARVVGFEGKLTFDSSKPDGAPRKLLDVSRLSSMGWSAGISLDDGLTDAYQWYLANQSVARGI